MGIPNNINEATNNMSKSKSLSWCDRLALIEHYNPSDDQIIKIMDVTQDELDTARDLQTTGAIVPTPNLDVDSYSKMFGISKPTTKSTAVTSTAKPTTAAPQTATKAPKVPKKRGRKGENIAKAFGAIPQSPVPAEQFAADNNVSIAVLRQSKRFDTNPELGSVHVKKDKKTNSLIIWRDAPES